MPRRRTAGLPEQRFQTSIAICRAISPPKTPPDSRIRTTSGRSRMGLWRPTALFEHFEHFEPYSSLIQAPESTRLKMCGSRYGCTHRAATSTRRDRLLFPIELKKRDGVRLFGPVRCVCSYSSAACFSTSSECFTLQAISKRSVWPTRPVIQSSGKVRRIAVSLCSFHAPSPGDLHHAPRCAPHPVVLLTFPVRQPARCDLLHQWH